MILNLRVKHLNHKMSDRESGRVRNIYLLLIRWQEKARDYTSIIGAEQVVYMLNKFQAYIGNGYVMDDYIMEKKIEIM